MCFLVYFRIFVYIRFLGFDSEFLGFEFSSGISFFLLLTFCVFRFLFRFKFLSALSFLVFLFRIYILQFFSICFSVFSFFLLLLKVCGLVPKDLYFLFSSWIRVQLLFFILDC